MGSESFLRSKNDSDPISFTISCYQMSVKRVASGRRDFGAAALKSAALR